MRIKLDAKEFDIPDLLLAEADQIVLTVVQRIVRIQDPPLSGTFRVKKITADVRGIDVVVKGVRTHVLDDVDDVAIPEVSGVTALVSVGSRGARLFRWLRP